MALRPLGLAAAVTLAASVPAGAHCLMAGPARSFRLDLDWAQPGPGETAPRRVTFSSGLSSPSPGTVGRSCPLLTAFDWNRRRAASDGSRAREAPADSPASTPAEADPSWLQAFSFFASLGGNYDTNINHDEEPKRDWGYVVGAGTRFETDAFELEYEVASHSYENTDRWDRISHSLTTSLDQRLTRRLSVEAVGEVALKGSSEDRELGDQYVFEPRIHYRFSPSNRLRLFGAHRLRRYDEDPQRDATNQYLGAEFRQRIGPGNLDFGYRWERNRSEGPRNRYRRQTYNAQYATPLADGLHRLALEVKYRPQQYSERFVDDEEDEGLRRDARWIFSAGASFALGRHLELVPGYKFEFRTSNDPEKEFDAHVGYLGLRFWFGSGGNPSIARRGASKPSTATAARDDVDVPRPKLAPDAPRPPSASPVATKGAEPDPPQSAPAAAPGSVTERPAALAAARTRGESRPVPPPRRAGTRNPTAEEPTLPLRLLNGSVFQCSRGISVPMSGAKVRLVGAKSSHTVETSGAGAFTFSGIPAGSYTLQIEDARLSPGEAASRFRIDLTRNVFGYVVRRNCAPNAVVIR